MSIISNPSKASVCSMRKFSGKPKHYTERVEYNLVWINFVQLKYNGPNKLFIRSKKRQSWSLVWFAPAKWRFYIILNIYNNNLTMYIFLAQCAYVRFFSFLIRFDWFFVFFPWISPYSEKIIIHFAKFKMGTISGTEKEEHDLEL